MEMTLEKRIAHAHEAGEAAYRGLREAARTIRSIISDVGDRRLSDDLNNLSSLVDCVANMVYDKQAVLDGEFAREAAAN